MSDGRHFLYLASGIPAWMAYMFPVTVLVAGLWLWGMIATGRRLRERPVGLAVRCVLPSFLTIGILVVGVVFAYDGPPPWADGHSPPAYPDYLINGLLLAHLPLGVLLAWRSGRQWPAVAGTSAAWAWASMCAGIEAGMSVAGEWL